MHCAAELKLSDRIYTKPVQIHILWIISSHNINLEIPDRFLVGSSHYFSWFSQTSLDQKLRLFTSGKYGGQLCVEVAQPLSNKCQGRCLECLRRSISVNFHVRVFNALQWCIVSARPLPEHCFLYWQYHLIFNLNRNFCNIWYVKFTQCKYKMDQVDGTFTSLSRDSGTLLCVAWTHWTPWTAFPSPFWCTV